MKPQESLHRLIEFLVSRLIDHPESASLRCLCLAEREFTWYLTLHAEDMRLVIGRHGFTISALRSLLKVSAKKHGVKANLKVQEIEI